MQGQPLTSDKAFVSLALFNILQFPLAMFPQVITSVIEARYAYGAPGLPPTRVG